MAETMESAYRVGLSAPSYPSKGIAGSVQVSGISVLMDRTSKNLALSGDILSRLLVLRDRLYGSRPEAACQRSPEAPPNGAMDAFSNQIKLQNEALEAMNQIVGELSGL